MRFILTVVLALLLLCIESVIVRRLGFLVTRLDTTVALLVFLAMRAGLQEGALASFVVGYLLDVMSGRPTGLFTFLAVLIFLMARTATSLVEVRSRASFVGFVAVTTIAHGFLAALFTLLSSQSGGLWPEVSGIPLQVVLSSVVASLLWPILRKLDPGRERPDMGVLR